MNTKVNAAYNTALALITSSTSGWTWVRAVAQVTIAFALNTEESNLVLNAQL